MVGHDHSLVADSYNNIGVVYDEKGDLENALLQYQRALEIHTRVFGSECLDVATSYRNIAVVYLQQEEKTKGFEFLTKAYDIQLKMLGSDHPKTQQLASFLELASFLGKK